ncbi:phosphonate C-P lyase system protein PhnL [Oleidesulfovibrio alaskensis G20]|uniref:Phosphonate C-P lyase system protein PhnL n=1 Tax=Oleidesulfovibrio alaskensis (strain ATCC BAA-1058 / DSM 17464 / G20) TaxID=207559 RepID=Q30W19_OLEA2|nr:phosphonate C-P lyase system protein PhnL [Oleidesulfovibrio alaskensis]ABB40127.1 phosphonate C-P lyase system protein PhnL [Oleidesulfovibrio alaskensis G20]MBG0773820.1 phosphonate C-P lyase system protein PhnL [Oleidesulfovibrio alaskensis]
MTVMLDVQNVCKTFTLHNQGGTHIAVFNNLSLQVRAGECVALSGRSGAGKSTLLRSLYANYKPTAGSISVLHRGTMVDIVPAPPRKVLEIRKYTIGYVSQFLRVIPRVTALDIVAAARKEVTGHTAEARKQAAELLERMNIPRRLWDIAPATFSGGEQQRVNIARGFAVPYPVLLLDEPTASLDGANKQIVTELIHEAKARGTAVVGIFHDDDVRGAVADRVFDMQTMEMAA